MTAQTLKGILFPLLLVCIALVSVHDAAWNMVYLWSTTDTFMHGWFVLPLAAIMAKNKAIPKVSPNPLSAIAVFVLCIPWVAALLIGKLSMINVLQQFALISIIPLTVLVSYGWRIAWHYRAPLLLVFFCIPVGDFLIPWLQSITADMSVFLLHLSGVSVLRNGWYISIPAADFRVAEACSGINFLISTFTVSIFYSFTYMEKIHKRVTFIFLGFAVPLLANGLRVYLIIMIAHWGNVEAATGFDHLVYGWIFFFVILTALFFIGNRWQDPEPAKENNGEPLSPRYLYPLKSPGLLVMLGSLVLMVSWVYSIEKSEISKDNKSASGTSLEQANIDYLKPQFPMADTLTVENLDGWLQYQAIYLDENVDKKMIGYQNRWFDANIWSIKEKHDVFIDGLRVSRWDLVGLSGKEFKLFISYCVGGEWESSILKVKALQVKHRFLKNDKGGVAYGWFTPINSNEDDLKRIVSKRKLCNI